MATTYRNTIEITDLSWNDLSSNVFSYRALASTSIALAKDSVLYWNGGSGSIDSSGTTVYDTVQGEDTIILYNLSGTNLSTLTFTGLFSNPSGTTQVGIVNTPSEIATGTNRRYTGLYYNIWNDNSQIIDSGFVSNIILYPDDDNGGPPQNSVPGIVQIAEPVTIKSSITNPSITNARVRIVGKVNDISGIGHTEETLTNLDSSSNNTYYPSNGGLWLGIDLEPNTGQEDYLYTFFANETCYHSDTLLQTLTGLVKIKDVKRGMKIKTKNGFKKIVRIYCNNCKKREFVVFEKDSLGQNIPNQKLMITKGHPVYYRGKYLNCLEFVKNNFFDKIYLKQMETEGVHHIQFETHECILTHNMWTTSLPHNMGNKIPEELYFDKSLFNPDDKGKHYPPYCLHHDPPRDRLDDDDLEHIGEFN